MKRFDTNETVRPVRRSLQRKRREPVATANGMSSGQQRIHRCLCLLLLTIIFEGLLRKLVPVLAMPLFFLKDFMVATLFLLSLKENRNPDTRHLLGIMGALFVLIFPCIILTAFHDPLLAVFGAKQYVLFPAVAVAVCAAYLPNHRPPLYSLFRLVAFSVLVTTLVAVIQNRLPAGHWLNQSVGGEDLSGFSAGGYLRVSSTFAFGGQYTYYLNALCYCLPTFFYLRNISFNRRAMVQVIAFIGLAIIGTFITGSRGAVIGNAGILSAAGLLAIFCGGTKIIGKIILPLAAGVLLLGGLQTIYPEFFAAYEARVQGTTAASHSIEMGNRIKSGLLDWTDGAMDAPPSLFGYGLGVMSNGSDKLSAYATQWRSSGFWTETDQATTFFEGGWYLIVVWYGFRVGIILYCLSVLFRLRRLEYRLVGCFACGFIGVIGVCGTLSIQPPLAIWWWLAIGLVVCLGRFDQMPSSPEARVGDVQEKAS